MKKYLLIILLSIFSVSIIAQTGTGWAQQRSKVNFKDSTNFVNRALFPASISIGGITITTSGTELNYSDNVTSDIQTQLNARKYQTYDYYIEEVAGTVYARPSPNTSYTAYNGSILSGVLNSAMSQLTTGGKIYIEAGQYDDNDSIRIAYNNITIQGAGMWKTIIKLKANYDAAKSPYGGQGFIAAMSKNGVQIRDLQIDGNGANQTYIGDGSGPPVARICGINMYATSANYLIERVYVHDVTEVGIKLYGTYGVLKDSYFVDCYHNGVTVNGGGFAGCGSGHINVENCIVRGGGDVGITVYGTHNTVRGCTAIDINGVKGSTSTFAGFGIEGSGPTMTYGNVIENNRVYGDCLYGIFSYQNAKGSVIQNNEIYGFSKSGSHGIDIAGGYGQQIIGNYIHDMTAASNGIVLLGDTLSTVQGNKVLKLETANSYGINLNDSYMDVVSENDVITAGGGAGIILQSDANYNILDNNKAKGISGLDINADANYNRVFNNILTGTGGAAFDFVDAGTGTVKGINTLITGTYRGELEIGNYLSNTIASIDSLTIVDSKIASYIAADTTDNYITFANRTEAVALADSGAVAEPKHYATSNMLQDGLALKANINSPALTGTPTAPTAATGTNTTQLATTAFVRDNANNFLTIAQGNGCDAKALPCAVATGQTSAGGNLTESTVYYIKFYLPKTTTITGVKFVLSTAGVFVGADFNGAGIYSVSGTTWTRIDTTANDANIWKTASSVSSATFVNGPHSLSAGYYYVGFVYNDNDAGGETAPAMYHYGIYGDSNMSVYWGGVNDLEASNSGELVLPASDSEAGTVPTGNIDYIWLY